MPYRLSALAEQDIEEIWSYVAEDESYVVYYRHDADVQIARVLHGRRDQTAAWSD